MKSAAGYGHNPSTEAAAATAVNPAMAVALEACDRRV
jgi:hypothetical protein